MFWSYPSDSFHPGFRSKTNGKIPGEQVNAVHTSGTMIRLFTFESPVPVLLHVLVDDTDEFPEEDKFKFMSATQAGLKGALYRICDIGFLKSPVIDSRMVFVLQ